MAATEEFKKPHVVLGPHMGHQEMERVVVELETILTQFPVEQSISVANLAQFISHNLGYEDVDELEDALQGDFLDFLRALPTVVIEDGTADEGAPAAGEDDKASAAYKNESRHGEPVPTCFVM